MECVSTASLSVWLRANEADRNVMCRVGPLGGLAGRGGDRLRGMYGNHAGRLEFGKVEAEFVLHPRKGGRGQSVASDVGRVDGGKLRDARLGGGDGSRRTAAEERRIPA